MAYKAKAAHIVEQFPWGHYITEQLRPQLTSMVETYLQADTFEHAQEAYNKFMNEYHHQPLHDDPKDYAEKRVIFNWYFDNVYSWKDILNQAWLDFHGPRHTRDEVMKIAADFWCERIFDSSRQDNGDNSDTGILGMMMASMLKTDSMDKQDASVRDKAWHLIAEYYGKVFDHSTSNRFENGLSVDYHPCKHLYDILKKAGVEEGDIDRIVPFKTNLSLRDFDKSLIGTAGYRNCIDL